MPVVTRPLTARRCRRGAAVGACALACGAAGLSFLAPSPLAPATQALRGAAHVRGRGGEALGSLASTAPTAAAIVGLAAALRARQAQALTARRATSSEVEEDFDDVPFEIRGFSLSQVALLLGVFLIVFSFGDYFIFGKGGTGIGGLTFIYAVPVLLLGAALTYAELQPVDVETDPDAVGLFDSKATGTLKKIKSDVTRHRYGDDAHLDSSLKALGLVAPAGRYPQLQKIVESKSTAGELEFKLLFQSKDVPFTTWSDPMKIVACDRFFGPGVWSEITKYDSGNRIACLKLTTGPRPSSNPAPATMAEAGKAAAAEAAQQA